MDGSKRVESGTDMAEVSLLVIATGLLRRWRLIVFIPLGLALLVGVSSLLSTRQYSATSAFMLQRVDPRAGAAGLAAQLGLSTGASTTPETPEFYQYLLKSPDLLREAATTTTVGSPPVSLAEYFAISADSAEAAVRGTVRRLDKSIQVNVSGTGVVHVETQAPDPLAAVEINRRLLDLVDSFNLTRRQTRARAEREFVEARLAEARLELTEAENELEAFLQQNRRIESPSLTFEAARLERVIATRQDVHSALSQAFEQARIEEVRNTPMISVVSSPENSVRPVGRGTILKMLLAGMAGMILALGLALILEYFAHSRRESPGVYAAFSEARRAVVSDLLVPLRLRRRESGAQDAAAVGQDGNGIRPPARIE